MADALISPAVGGIMWVAAAGTAAFSIKKLQKNMDEKRIPMMGVMGAFVFAAQMINFAIPGTGSSGHIGGGILLAVLLGPYAGFLTMASVLLIQALLFGDGGLLAFGCNLINMGFFTCFVAYPLLYRNMTRKGLTVKRILPATILSAIVGLQLGAFGVVLDTLLSGKTELPFKTFLLFMQPIHLVIGLIEGVIISAVISFVWKARPEILESTVNGTTLSSVPVKRILIGFTIAAILLAGFVSWFASTNPDGLEWSISKVTGAAAEAVNMTAANNTAIDSAKSVQGLIGGLVTLAFAVLLGFASMLFRKNKRERKE